MAFGNRSYPGWGDIVITDEANVELRTRRVVAIHTVFALLGLPSYFLFLLFSALNGNARYRPHSNAFDTLLATMHVLVFVTLVSSIIGARIAVEYRRVALAFVAVPWIFLFLAISITVLS